MKRKPTPRTIAHAVFTKSRRRCALCYYWDGDGSWKKGHLAHIDRDPSRNAEENLAFLCLEHHDTYDSKSRQTKGILPDELQTAKKYLEDQVAKDFLALVKRPSSTQLSTQSSGVSIEVYRMRYPVYAAFRKFVRSILRDADVSDEERIEFVNGVADALFLLGGEEIEQYLDKVYRKALNYVRVLRIIAEPDRLSKNKWEEALEQDGELLLWFEGELTKGKQLFAKYLTLAANKQ